MGGSKIRGLLRAGCACALIAALACENASTSSLQPEPRAVDAEVMETRDAEVIDAAPLSVEAFCRARTEQEIARLVACVGGSTDYHRAVLGQASSLDDCLSMKRAIDDGELRFDAAAAARCLDGFAAAPCPQSYQVEPSAWDQDCRSVWTGILELGASCRDAPTDACRAGTTCDDNKFLGRETCTYRCVERREVQLGEACGTPDVYCGDDLSCVGGSCVPAPGLGASCRDLGYCASSYWCDPATARCRERRTRSSTCASYWERFLNECEAGTDCLVPLTSNGPGVCGTRARIGEPCVPGGCALSGAACDRGVCVAAPLIGERCSAANPQSEAGRCALGGICPSTTQTCVRPKAVGEACAQRDECATGLRCQGTCYDPHEWWECPP